MRQHAIPQNILDVEFKLFTKFTLKEFAYLAIGVGTGGVVIYLTVGNVIPSLLGVPVFIITSGLGIFLGLVPVNGQDADVFIKNYILAITSPTQRVWLTRDMKRQRTKPDVKPDEEGRLVPKDMKTTKKKKVIGESLAVKKKIIDENKIPDMLDEDLDIDEELTTSSSANPKQLIITSDNISNYQFKIKSLDKLPGNINVWLCTKDLKPIPNVIVYLKDSDGKILYANKTGNSGYFLTNKLWEPSTYMLEFQHPTYEFPKVKLEINEKEKKLPIKINSI